MDDYSAQVKSVVKSAIGDLQRLATDALDENNYAAVAEVAAVAERLHQILAELGPIGSSPTPSKSSRQRAMPRERVRSNRASKGPTRRAGRGQYPQFRRDGDKLVKVGWSKKARKEYEHRAPKEAIDALLKSIRTKFGGGEYFTAPDILPVVLESGGKLPDYQCYLVIKWLHSFGAIQKKGRDQYALSLRKDYASEIASHWSDLKSV